MEWSGVEWRGVEWSGVEWRGVEWRGVEWSGVEWSGVEWSGVEWSGVAWSGVEWSGVEWSGVSKRPLREQAMPKAPSLPASQGAPARQLRHGQMSTRTLRRLFTRKSSGSPSMTAAKQIVRNSCTDEFMHHENLHVELDVLPAMHCPDPH